MIPIGHQRRPLGSKRSFTLVELLVVIAIIGILASLILVGLTEAKAKGQSIVCLNNLKQLQLAWLMYADDHNGIMCPNWYYDGGSSYLNCRSVPGAWVIGNPMYSASLYNIENGVLFSYTRAVRLYHCPADRSLTIIEPKLPRILSYGLSGGLHMFNFEIPTNSRLYGFIKIRLSELVRPPPSQVLGFVDYSEKTIVDGVFWVDPIHLTQSESTKTWISVPSDRHSMGVNLSFADGHVEHHRWKAPKQGGWRAHVAGPEDLEDLRWVQQRFPQP